MMSSYTVATVEPFHVNNGLATATLVVPAKDISGDVIAADVAALTVAIGAVIVASVDAVA
jgi:hypothetical protein